VSSKPVTVNKTITDPVLGLKFDVLKYVANYQPSAAAKAKYSALEDEDVVLVEVKVTVNSQYYVTAGAGDLYLTGTANGIDEASTTILDDELTKAGYPALKDAETSGPKTSTGWVAFTPKKGLTKLVLRYDRLAYNGGKIPAKKFDLRLN